MSPYLYPGKLKRCLKKKGQYISCHNIIQQKNTYVYYMKWFEYIRNESCITSPYENKPNFCTQ